MSGSKQAKSPTNSPKEHPSDTIISKATTTSTKSKSTGKLKTEADQDAPPISIPIKHKKGKAKSKNPGWSILAGLERFLNRTKDDSLRPSAVDINNTDADDEDLLVDRSTQTSEVEVSPSSTVEELTTAIEKLQHRREQIMSGSKPEPSPGPGTSGKTETSQAPAPNVKDDSSIISHLTPSKPSTKHANTDNESQNSPTSTTPETTNPSGDPDKLDNPSILTQLASKSKTITKGQPETPRTKRKVSFKGEEPSSILSFLVSNPREEVPDQQEPDSTTNGEEVPGPSGSDNTLILYQRPTKPAQSQSNLEKSTIFTYVSKTTLPPTQEKPVMPKEESTVDEKIDAGPSILDFLAARPRTKVEPEKSTVEEKIEDGPSILNFLVSKPRVNDATEKPAVDKKNDDGASTMSFLASKPKVKDVTEETIEKPPVSDAKPEEMTNPPTSPISDSKQKEISNNPAKSHKSDTKQKEVTKKTESPISEADQKEIANPANIPASNKKQEQIPNPEKVPGSEANQEEIPNPASSPTSDKKQKEITNPKNSPVSEASQEEIANPENSPVSKSNQKETANPENNPVSEVNQEEIANPENNPVSEVNQEETPNPVNGPASDKKQDKITNPANTPVSKANQEEIANPANSPVSEANPEEITNSEIKSNKQDPPTTQAPMKEDKPEEENVMGRSFQQEVDNTNNDVAQHSQNAPPKLVDRSAQTSEVRFASSSNMDSLAKPINELQDRPTSVHRSAQTSELELPVIGQSYVVGEFGTEVAKLQDRQNYVDISAQTSEVQIGQEELSKSIAGESVKHPREKSVQFLQNEQDRPIVNVNDGSTQTSELQLRTLLNYLSLKQLLSEEDALLAAASGIDKLPLAESEVQDRQISADKSCQTSELNLGQPSAAQDELKKSIDEARPTTLQDGTDGSTAQEVETQDRPISRSSQTPEPQSIPEGLPKFMMDEKRDDLGDDSTIKSLRNSGGTSVDRSSQSTEQPAHAVDRSSKKEEFIKCIDQVQDIKCLIKNRLLGILLNDPEMEELVFDILMGICDECSNKNVEEGTAATSDPQKPPTEQQSPAVSTQTEYKQYAHCLQIEEETCRQQRSSRMFAYFCPLQCDNDSYDEDDHNNAPFRNCFEPQYYQNDTLCWQPPTNCFCHNQRSSPGNEEGSRRNSGTATDHNKSMSLQDAFKQCHSQCYQRVHSRQQSVTNSKRTRESVKAFAEKFKQKRNSSSSKGQSTERTGYSGRRGSISKSCRPVTSPDGESNYENEPCEAFTYVVPKSHVYWRCI